MTIQTTYHVGDKVTVDHPKYPGVWTVKSVGPVNTVLVPENGGSHLRAPHYLLRDPDAAPSPSVTTFPATLYSPGELVRITEGRFAGLYVVLADKGDKVNVAKLGGDGGRYVRSFKRSLVKVDVAEVLK